MNMAVGDALSNAGGAVDALFRAKASEKKADMYRIMSQADLLKGQGDILEAGNYDRAGELALKNKAYTAQSVAVQQAQADRAITMSLGGARAATGASGLTEDSSFDVLRASSQQGALQKEVLAQQGLISEEGFQEQHDTYVTMSQVAHLASDAETLASQGHIKAAEAEDLAAQGSYWTAGIKAVGAVAALLSGGIGGGGGGGDAVGGAEAAAMVV
jgi:hypothetical protein